MKRQLFLLVIVLICAAGAGLWTREKPPVDPAPKVVSTPQRQSSYRFELPKVGPQLETVPGEEWFTVTLTNHGPRPVEVPLLGEEGNLRLDTDLHFTTVDGDRPNPQSWCGNGTDFDYFTVNSEQSARGRFRREALRFIARVSPAIIHVTVEAKIDGTDVTLTSPPVEVTFDPWPREHWEAHDRDEGVVRSKVQIIREHL